MYHQGNCPICNSERLVQDFENIHCKDCGSDFTIYEFNEEVV